MRVQWPIRSKLSRARTRSNRNVIKRECFVRISFFKLFGYLVIDAINRIVPARTGARCLLFNDKSGISAFLDGFHFIVLSVKGLKRKTNSKKSEGKSAQKREKTTFEKPLVEKAEDVPKTSKMIFTMEIEIALLFFPFFCFLEKGPSRKKLFHIIFLNKAIKLFHAVLIAKKRLFEIVGPLLLALGTTIRGIVNDLSVIERDDSIPVFVSVIQIMRNN